MPNTGQGKEILFDYKGCNNHSMKNLLLGTFLQRWNSAAPQLLQGNLSLPSRLTECCTYSEVLVLFSRLLSPAHSWRRSEGRSSCLGQWPLAWRCSFLGGILFSKRGNSQLRERGSCSWKSTNSSQKLQCNCASFTFPSTTGTRMIQMVKKSQTPFSVWKNLSSSGQSRTFPQFILSVHTPHFIVIPILPK